MALDQAQKDKQEERAVNEEVRKQQKHLDEQHKSRLDEYERVFALIKDCRKELKDPDIDDDYRMEIESDNAHLLKKNQLTKELNY